MNKKIEINKEELIYVTFEDIEIDVLDYMIENGIKFSDEKLREDILNYFGELYNGNNNKNYYDGFIKNVENVLSYLIMTEAKGIHYVEEKFGNMSLPLSTKSEELIRIVNDILIGLNEKLIPNIWAENHLSDEVIDQIDINLEIVLEQFLNVLGVKMNDKVIGSFWRVRDLLKEIKEHGNEIEQDIYVRLIKNVEFLCMDVVNEGELLDKKLNQLILNK